MSFMQQMLFHQEHGWKPIEMQIDVLMKEVERLKSENSQLKEGVRVRDFMIENGLGWDDMVNDCQ